MAKNLIILVLACILLIGAAEKVSEPKPIAIAGTSYNIHILYSDGSVYTGIAQFTSSTFNWTKVR